jgi:hypothetical protein
MHRDIYLSVKFSFVNQELSQGYVSVIEDLLYPDYYRLLENNSKLLPEDSFFFLLAPEKPIIVTYDNHAVFYYPVFTMREEFTLTELEDFCKLWLKERQGVSDCGQDANCIY